MWLAKFCFCHALAILQLIPFNFDQVFNYYFNNGLNNASFWHMQLIYFFIWILIATYINLKSISFCGHIIFLLFIKYSEIKVF